MSKKRDFIYDSETGDVLDPSAGEGVPAVEPLRIPGIVEQFIEQYIPAPDECTADEVISIGELRTRLSCWFTFGSKEDVLNDYLKILDNEGFNIIDTSSGPALCVIQRNSPRVINSFAEADEMI